MEPLAYCFCHPLVPVTAGPAGASLRAPPDLHRLRVAHPREALGSDQLQSLLTARGWAKRTATFSGGGPNHTMDMWFQRFDP